MRTFKINLFMIITIMLLLLGQVSPAAERVETAGIVSLESEQTAPSVIAHFHLSGVLSETDMVDALGLTAGQITSLRSLVELMEKAGKDDDVKAVILTFDDMSMGFGQLEELRGAINRLKEAGKKVYVHAEEMNILVYSLLCSGSNLSIAPQSALWFIGIYTESVHVKDLLDKIGVRGEFLHMGDYKSAAEIFTRTEPSKPAEDNINWLLDSYYESLVKMISQSRGISAERLRELIDNGPYLAEQALEKGLIDAVETREEFLARVNSEIEGRVVVNNRYGHDEATQIDIANPFAIFALLSEMLNPPQKPQKDSVALIYVEGTIVSGHSQPSLLGQSGGAFSGDIRKAIETAAEDDSVKAVVMRVDSPGGSAEASEVILNATRMLKGKKPFIVSMGNVAGSGGYYISCGADTIFADEVTVTASIGVVGGKLITADMWDKLGVNWIGYKRGANADFMSGLQPFNESQNQKLEDYMQAIYDVFKDHVTKGRADKLKKPLEEIAGGRVYTGKQALELGLVDEIGGINRAINYAAAQASLEDYDVRVIPRPKDIISLLMEEYTGQGEKPTDIALPDTTSLFSGNPTFISLFELLRQIEPQRAKALYQALMRVELIRRENVIMMMPFELVIN
ncbi:MAG: signal peptide peptidase SppA [Sedimentisphaerales bacterium]|nr:signal peptide peptidase SppA [Sedimentisphaerales bacterium]